MVPLLAEVQAAIERDDAAALLALTEAVSCADDKELAGALFKLAHGASEDHPAVGIALQELAMAVRGASHAAFNNALWFLLKLPAIEPALATSWLDRAVPRAPANPHIFHNAACVYVRLGELERAIRMVAGAVLYSYAKLAKLKADPDLDPLRGLDLHGLLSDTRPSGAVLRELFQGGPRIAPPPAARNLDLEAAILADPAAIEPYLVYGDWLQERGDPRGDLIAIQRARLRDPDNAELVGREAAHLARHADALLGALAVETRTHDRKHDAAALTWHLGFVRRARFRHVCYQVQDRHVPDVDELVRGFLRDPSARFLDELVIGVVEPDGDHDEVVAAIVEARPATLRRLHLADFEPSSAELSWVRLGDLGALWRALPGLERLIVRGGTFELGAIDGPNLIELAVRTAGLSRRNLERISTARWPRLQRLEVWFGSTMYGSEATVGDLRELLAGDTLPAVTALGLRNAEFTDDLCEVLATAAILPRLSELDLSMGTLTPAGLATLIAHASAFAHLDVLDLSENHLVGDLDPRVAQLARRVVLDDQRDPFDDGERYVAMGE